VTKRSLLPRLLAGRPDLTRDEKDQIFDAVMREVGGKRRARLLAPMLALAGAAAALIVVPLVLRHGPPPSLTARGGATVATFSVLCGASGPTCRAGDTLLFDVKAPGWRYFTAFARREDGAIIWYTSPDGAVDLAADLAASAGGGVLGTGIVLDEEHRPGRYQVYGVFSRQPLDRAQIRARFQPEAASTPASAGADTEVVVRGFEIQ
jgi:hypothetical protein